MRLTLALLALLCLTALAPAQCSNGRCANVAPAHAVQAAPQFIPYMPYTLDAATGPQTLYVPAPAGVTYYVVPEGGSGSGAYQSVRREAVRHWGRGRRGR